MGAVLEMMTLRIVAAVVVSALLAGCGNDVVSTDYKRPFQAVLARLGTGPAVPTLATLNQSGTLALRQALEEDGQPIYLVAYDSLKYKNLMAPYGQNGGVQTWASQEYESISLRGGMLVATRGFGGDLMSSNGPTIAQIAAARGTTQRQNYYLDGADQPRRFDYTCVLAAAGSESIVILAKTHATRKVTETCTGNSTGFVNEYWFDSGTNLRQSRQLIAPETTTLLMQRVID
jgi:hypothetical protein